LNGVDLTVEARSIVGLIGGSGGGKTTLARCIAGLIDPDAGEIIFDGVNIFPNTANRRKIGIQIQLMFQAGSEFLNPRMTIEDSLAEAIEARGADYQRSQIHDRGVELLRAVGLQEETLGKYPHQLSGGQRQRVGLARVLAVRPQLVIMDEPTSALDVLTQVQIHRLLRNVHRASGLAMLYITHDMPAAATLCDELAVLAEGRIVEHQSTSAILRSPQHEYTREILNLCRIAP
jgi:peptide/nickel transport system ATP-binding protein